jgi:hypothetical protein
MAGAAVPFTLDVAALMAAVHGGTAAGESNS